MSQYEPKEINKGEGNALLYNETLTHTKRRNDGIRKSSMNAKPNEWQFNKEQGIYIVSKSILTNYLTNFKGEKQDKLENPGRCQLKWSKWTSSIWEQIDIMCLKEKAQWQPCQKCMIWI